MALEGTLLEFPLPDIFQLIAQQKKTGKLVLQQEKVTGFIIFQNGNVIAARKTDDWLPNLLFRYLVAVKNYHHEEINEVIISAKNSIRVLARELISKRYLSPEELTAFGTMTIEDIACGLFLWKNGNYRFEMLDSVNEFKLGDVALSADAITMEAMRRTDEWNRIGTHISERSIFALNPDSQEDVASTQHLKIFEVFIEEALLTEFNGIAPIKDIVQNSFLCEYRIFEISAVLIARQKLIDVTQKFQQIQKASVEQNISRDRQSYIAVTAFVSVAVFCAIFFLGFVFKNYILLHRKTADQRHYSTIVASEQNRIKIAAASLYFRAENEMPLKLMSQLHTSGLLTEKETR